MEILINHDSQSQPIMPDKSDPIVAGVLSGGKKDKKDKKRKQQPSNENFVEVSLNHVKMNCLHRGSCEVTICLRKMNRLKGYTKGSYHSHMFISVISYASIRR
jgi:hypothetical protein